MTTRQTVTINTQSDRDQIARWARNVEPGTVVTFRKKSRSTEQSAKMWAMLHEVSEQVEWYGQKIAAEDWKDVFSASLRHTRVVPGIDKGTFVPLGMHTSTMTIEEMSNLIELIYAFGAEHGVVFKDPQQPASDASPTSEPDGPVSSEEAGDTPPSSPASTPSRDLLIRYARDVLNKAADPKVSDETLKKVEMTWSSDLSKLNDEDRAKARAIAASMRAVANDPIKLEGVLEHYADMLECPVADLEVSR